MDEQVSHRKNEDSEWEAVSRLGQRCLGEAEESARIYRSISLRKDGRGLSRAVVISDHGEDMHGKLPSTTWSHW